MSASQFVNDVAGKFGSFVESHPIYAAAAGALIGVVPAIRIFSTLTASKCRCSTDMTGKTVIITGASSGIGKATAQDLAKCGARVIMACRNQPRGQMALEEIAAIEGVKRENLVLKMLDLCSFASVRAFADDMIKSEDKLDILINNAGVTGTADRRVTEDGLESIMQCNFFGPFLLTNLLTEKLEQNSQSRIINVSSMMYKYETLDFEDMNSERNYASCKVYCRSKMALNIFTRELSQRLLGTGVTVNCLHPGVVKTEIARESSGMDKYLAYTFMSLLGKSPSEGAQTIVHLSKSEELVDVTGKYFAECKEVPLEKYAACFDNGRKLWTLAEQVVQLSQ